MTNEIRYQEWEDSNKYNAYPFSDTSTFKTINNTVVLRSLFLDASIHIIGATPPFYIKEILPLSESSAEIRIGTANATRGYSAYAVVDLSNSGNIIRVLDLHNRDAGIILTNDNGKDDLIALVNQEELRFRADALEFVTNVCIPLPEVGFRGFILPDGTVISGSVVLAGENGVVLNDDNGRIRIDVVGDPYYARNCLLDQNIPQPPLCAVKTINGIAPDENGDFKITSGGYNATDTALRIYPVDGGLQITLLGN